VAHQAMCSLHHVKAKTGSLRWLLIARLH
jgi:hypothetical protein